jgi:hypothetical protein
MKKDDEEYGDRPQSLEIAPKLLLLWSCHGSKPTAIKLIFAQGQ